MLPAGALAIPARCRYDPQARPPLWAGLRTRQQERESMNPLDSIWGTIIAGVVIALILAAIFPIG